MTILAIAHLAVALDDVERKVTRRLAVPLDCRLDRLHLILQAAFGWTNSHLWEIRVRDTSWGVPDPAWPEGPRDARKETLSGVIEQTGAKTLHYLYDFGDSWEHTIKILKIGEAESGTAYPVLLDASGRFPPEDIGGPWGYEEFLEAIKDPDHERHEELTEWYPADFDPDDAPLDDLKAAVAALAKHGARKAPRNRAR